MICDLNSINISMIAFGSGSVIGIFGYIVYLINQEIGLQNRLRKDLDNIMGKDRD